MSCASGKFPATHRELVPLMVIYGNAKRTERLGQRKQALDVFNAPIYIVVAHTRPLRLTRTRSATPSGGEAGLK